MNSPEDHLFVYSAHNRFEWVLMEISGEVRAGGPSLSLTGVLTSRRARYPCVQVIPTILMCQSSHDRLFHPVDALHELPDPVLLAGFLKPRGLFHERDLVRGEHTVKKSCFNIELVKIPIKGGSEMEYKAERLESSSGSGCLIVIDAVLSRNRRPCGQTTSDQMQGSAQEK